MSNVFLNPQPAHLIEDSPWRTWEKRQRTASKTINASDFRIAERQQDVDFSNFTPKKYIFSHATIVGGVEPEAENGYRIRTEHSDLVNDNGNAWYNQVLLESYKSFIMAENYLEHVQIKQLSKGKILDAVAWVVEDKADLPTVFIDILVATNKKHVKLCNAIRDKSMNSMSMGCNITHFQCSRCGEVFEEDEGKSCRHIDYQLGKSFKDDGKSYRIAEMCGVAGIPHSCEFIEASWVATPAFTPAIRHDSLQIGDAWVGSPLRAKIPKRRIDGANPE
jgi:rubredoxin